MKNKLVGLLKRGKHGNRITVHYYSNMYHIHVAVVKPAWRDYIKY